MYELLVDASVDILARYGLVVLLVAFVMEGALVGKLVPTRVLFVSTILAVGSDAVDLAAVATVAVVGATLGQVLLFVLVSRTDRSVESLPGPVGPTVDGRLHRYLDRWGMTAVALSNAFPVTRGSLTVPVALADGNPVRFSAFSMVGSIVYCVGLGCVAVGLDVATGLV